MDKNFCLLDRQFGPLDLWSRRWNICVLSETIIFTLVLEFVNIGCILETKVVRQLSIKLAVQQQMFSIFSFPTRTVTITFENV